MRVMTKSHSKHTQGCIHNFCFLPAWWLWREACTRSHSELGRENSQRRWYFVLRHGRVGRRQACKKQKLLFIISKASDAGRPPPWAQASRAVARAAVATCQRHSLWNRKTSPRQKGYGSKAQAEARPRAAGPNGPKAKGTDVPAGD